MLILNFTSKVLGQDAAKKLLKKEVIQTLRSPNEDLVEALLHSEIKIGNEIEVALDGEVIGRAHLSSIDRTNWDTMTLLDASRGGFTSLPELSDALHRAGYRFSPIEQYQFYRVQFTWSNKGEGNG